MPQLIKGNAIVDDCWQFIPRDHEGALPDEGHLLVPLEHWQALSDEDRWNERFAPWIDSDQEVEEVADDLLQEPLVAIHFPSFTDGRGFSTAQILRNRYDYHGELRAIGYLIQDQLFYLKRCGFDSIQLREGTDLEAALKSLEIFSEAYQTSADTPEPLFRRRRT